MKQRLKTLLEYLSLEAELDDFERIHESIEQEIVFKGTNLWILVFAILVASVGLNMNSTAVIIGAMLISPLMGPINGMGYSLATYNFPLFQRALKNFTFAVLAALASSTVYFFISPVSTAHSELLARTSPTIYDVLIALFGGLAGIVAISSRKKGNVIPGVAIATALMPPLCTAGYGLATAQYNFFFGAFYLFTINTVFIALSSVAISQFLSFPIRTLVDKAQKVRVNRWITIVMLITLIPSIYFGYSLVQQERFVEQAKRFVDDAKLVEGNYLLDHQINTKKHSIVLIYGGAPFSAAQKKRLLDRADYFSLSPENIRIEQGIAFDRLNTRSKEADYFQSEINRLNTVVASQQQQYDSLLQLPLIGSRLLKEMRSLYPQITGCSYAESFVFDQERDGATPVRYVIIETAGGGIEPADEQKLTDWLNTRLEGGGIKLLLDCR